MSNLGMQLELTMTAKGVQATLKDAQGAIVQTAQVVKSQLGPDGEGTKALGHFKEGISRARETAMFFTASLGEFGPAGRTAQMALSGVAGAVLGGGGVLLALEGARVAVRLLTDGWEEEAQKAKEAADAAKQAAVDIANALKEAQGRVGEMGGRRATGGASSRTALANEEALALAAQQAKVDAARKMVDDATSPAAVLDAQELLKTELQGMQEIRNAFLLKSQELAEKERVTAQAATAAVRQDREADADRAMAVASFLMEWKVDLAQQEADRRIAVESHLMEWREEMRQKEMDRDSFLMEWRAELDDELAKKAKENAEKQMKTFSDLADAVGKAFANMVTGAQSVKGAMADMLKSVVNMVIEAVKTQVLANAVATAAEAAKSQAGIPVVGPILAGAAMVAMLSMVQGLVGSIPSAAGGWERVPRDGIAMIHQDEQVLPATYAEGLRGLIANGGGSGVTVNLNVSAMDAKSFEQYALDNNGAIARAVGRAVRDGRRFG